MGINRALSQARMFDMPDTLVSRVARGRKMEVSASSKGFESYASFMMPFSRLPGVPPRLQGYNVTASSTLALERTSEGSLYRTKRHCRRLQKRLQALPQSAGLYDGPPEGLRSSKELPRSQTGNHSHGARLLSMVFVVSFFDQTDGTDEAPARIYVRSRHCQYQASASLQLLGNPDSFLTESTPLRD